MYDSKLSDTGKRNNTFSKQKLFKTKKIKLRNSYLNVQNIKKTKLFLKCTG